MSPAPARITTAQELRHAWTEFFAERGHTSVPPGSLIPTHPSAPMFTNSGLMPFVPYFLGEEPVPFVPPRAVSVQKCVRAGGKHNDLDAIGRSPRHPNLVLATGHGMLGVTMSAVTAELVTDLICARPPALDPAPLGLQRFA